MKPERAPGETVKAEIPPVPAEVSKPTAEEETGVEQKEISGEELTNVMVRNIRWDAYQRLKDSLNLSEEEMSLGPRHAEEWSLESKNRYVEAVMASEGADDYMDRLNAYMDKHNLVMARGEKASEETEEEEETPEETETAEGKETERKMNLFHKIGHKALKALEAVKGFVNENKKKIVAVAAGVALLTSAAFGASKLAERNRMKDLGEAPVAAGEVDDDIVESLAESLPIYNPDGDLVAHAQTGENAAEDSEAKEAFNVKGDMRAIGYEAYDTATGTWRWDLTSSDYHIAKAGKYNFSNFRKFNEDYAAEHNLDPNDLNTAKESLLNVYEKSGSAGMAPLIYNLVDEGIGNFDKDFGDLNTNEIKALLEKRPDLAEKSMDEIKEIWGDMEISEDQLDPNTKYYNFYLSPEADGDVTVVEYGAKGEKGDYYSVSSEKSAESQVYKLSYKDADGEVKVLYFKKICGQLVNEKGFYAKEVPPEITTTITTEPIVTTVDIPTTTSTTETTTTNETTTTSETTTTKPKTTETTTTTTTVTTWPNFTTTSTSTYTTPETTTTSSYTTTEPVTTTTAPVVTTGPVVSSGPGTGGTEPITTPNLSKNTDVYSGPNWGIIPGGEETAAEPVEFSKTTHTTAVEQPEGLEDISGYQNTDAQGNPTNTNYAEQVGYDDAKKEEDAKRREREAEQGNPNQPFIPADALPPSGDDSNNLEI